MRVCQRCESLAVLLAPFVALEEHCRLRGLPDAAPLRAVMEPPLFAQATVGDLRAFVRLAAAPCRCGVKESPVSVLLLSGGLDSLVLLARECQEGRPPLCVSFFYGQRHAREMNAAAKIADHYGVGRLRLDLPEDSLKGSALTDGAGVSIPLDKHYADPSQAATVVPNRILLFLSAAAAVAAGRGLKTVLFAVHRGDAAVYPDCRPEFVAAADAATQLGCGVGVEAPFLG